MKKITENISLTDVAFWGTVSGGFTCYYLGGTYFEKYPGDKLTKINELIKNKLFQFDKFY